MGDYVSWDIANSGRATREKGEITMNHRHLGFAYLCTVIGCALGCGGVPDGATTDEGSAVGRPSKGSQGPAVRAAYDYLYAYGYFPNEALAEQYPTWHPVVPLAPRDPNVFDDYLERALIAFQRNLGLPVTKVIDEATVALMRAPRCGHPDSDPDDRTDKWAHSNSNVNRWNKQSIAYRFEAGFSSAQQATIANAIDEWEPFIDLSFTKIPPWWFPPPAIDFVIRPQLLEPHPRAVAQGSPPPNPAMGFDLSRIGSTADLRYAAKHEAGHLLGLGHSSFGNGNTNQDKPVMWPVLQTRTSFDDDDIMGANVLYNDWEKVGGWDATDIGSSTANTNGTGEAVWIVGSDCAPKRWDEGAFQFMNSGPPICARRIDVAPDGSPWIIDDPGRVMHLEGNVWVHVNGGWGHDVGVGRNGTVWVVGGDFRAYRVDGAGWFGPTGPSDQRRIDVEPNGTPWVTTADTNIWGMSILGWIANTGGFATDIALGGGPGNQFDSYRSYLWVAGTDGRPYVLNYQPAVNVPCGNNEVCPVEGRFGWVTARNAFGQTNLGSLVSITASPRGRVWALTGSPIGFGNIYRRLEMPGGF